MRSLRSAWALVALIALLVAWPLAVQAAARVIAPDGWLFSNGAAPEAQRRVGQWKTALTLPVMQVLSSPYEDRFAETIAVFERPEPIPAELFADEPTAVDLLAQTVSNVVGLQPPTSAGLRYTRTGELVAWGRWTTQDISYDCVLAPSGTNSTLVIMAVRADDIGDYSGTFERVVEGLTEVTEAMPRFSLLGWRFGAVLVWLTLALGLHALMLRFVDHEGDHGAAGSRAAMALGGLLLVGGALTYFGLSGRELAITSAGSSLAAVSMWVVVSGMVVAGLHLVVAKRLDPGVVKSAPSSGVFASSSFSSTYLSSSISRSSMKAEDIAAASGTWTTQSRLGLTDTLEPPSPEEFAASSSSSFPTIPDEPPTEPVEPSEPIEHE